MDRSEIPKKGLDITVVPREDGKTVLWKGNTFHKELLQKRVQKTKDFNQMTSGIVGLRQINIHGQVENNEVVVDSAKGFNLVGSFHLDTVGTDYDFYSILPKPKVQAMSTYLEVVKTLNENGRAFMDHKEDSVFVDKEGIISIVDMGSMKDEKKETSWKVYDRNPRHGLQKVLRSFFTRGVKGKEDYIPTTILKIINESESANSANEILAKVENWLSSSEPLPRNEYANLVKNMKAGINEIPEGQQGKRLRTFWGLRLNDLVRLEGISQTEGELLRSLFSADLDRFYDRRSENLKSKKS